MAAPPVRPGRAAARRRAGAARLLVRGRRLRPLGRSSAAHRGGVGEGRVLGRGDRTKRRFPWGDDAPTDAHANLGQTRYHPAAAGSFPAGASPSGVLQMVGDVWEWTSTEFTGYPGFRSFPYKEYSEVFFGDGYKVLRGGCWATDPLACRTTFRNWDHPIRRRSSPASGLPGSDVCGILPTSVAAHAVVAVVDRPHRSRAVLGAATAAARHGQRRRLRRRLVRRPAGSRCATDGPSRSGPTRRSRPWRRRSPRLRAGGGPLGDRRDVAPTSRPPRRSPTTAGCSATTAG